jgi:DNA-binding response OmpR family regulator
MAFMHPTSQFSPRVLLAVDDVGFRRRSEVGLRAAGFSVSSPTDAVSAAILAESFEPDVMVVDLSIAGPDNRPLYEHLRHGSDRYLICIEAAGREQSRAQVLRSGADDAVSLPVSIDELAARCQALLRRPRRRNEERPETRNSTITLGPLTVDSGRHEIRLCDVEIPATRIEFSLLAHLCLRPTEVAQRTELLEAVWGEHWVGDTHVVDVHLSNLRRKLEKAAPDLRVIHTVRGVGFRLGNDIVEPSTPLPSIPLPSIPLRV